MAPLSSRYFRTMSRDKHVSLRTILGGKSKNNSSSPPCWQVDTKLRACYSAYNVSIISSIDGAHVCDRLEMGCCCWKVLCCLSANRQVVRSWVETGDDGEKNWLDKLPDARDNDFRTNARIILCTLGLEKSFNCRVSMSRCNLFCAVFPK